MNELSFHQIGLESWVPGNYREIAILRYSSDELAEKHGMVFNKGYEDGLGETKEAGFLTSKGRQFSLVHYLWAPAPYRQMTNILSLWQADTLASDLEDILEVLNLGTEDLEWIEPTISFQKYEVWRQDDNGGKFLIEIAHSKADAKKIVRKYELIPHKQTYWIEHHKG
jgi:hypothetical protein